MVFLTLSSLDQRPPPRADAFVAKSGLITKHDTLIRDVAEGDMSWWVWIAGTPFSKRGTQMSSSDPDDDLLQ